MPSVSKNPGSNPPRVLAVSSGGGHWAELQRLRSAWEGALVTYVATDNGYKHTLSQDALGPDDAAPRFCWVPDANKKQIVRLALLAVCMLFTVLRTRPDVVISTGAAPGYFAVRFGKMLGARTIWVDSIANAEAISASGMLARPYSDLWLTQWAHLTQSSGAEHAGAVM